MKKSVFFLLAILVAIQLFADKVDEQTARNVAVNWFNEISGTKKYSSYSISDVYIKTEDSTVLLYLINISEDGFIIIPSDDNVRPVLAWCLDHPYNNEDHPPQFDYFIKMYMEAVKLGNNYIEEGIDLIQEWKSLKVNTEDFQPRQREMSVAPLLTCLWDQCENWNIYCPSDPLAWCGNQHVPVGCVATAMAQIMYFWKYPNNGEGSNSYTSNYGNLSVNFGATNYLWSQMDDYVGTSASALLSYHCGVSVDMQYDTSGSGAFSEDVDNAFRDHFRYHDDASFKNRYSNYSDWVALLKSDLDLGRPVYYRGCDPVPGEGCHAWVIDGYSSNDIFHVNYGWGGFNGWYSIANVPWFTDGQSAVVYIYPEIPIDLVLSTTNTGGTYTAYNSITMIPGFETGTVFTGQIFEPNKGATLKILKNDILVFEMIIDREYINIYPDLWNGKSFKDATLKQEEYQYSIIRNNTELEKGTIIIK